MMPLPDIVLRQLQFQIFAIRSILYWLPPDFRCSPCRGNFRCCDHTFRRWYPQRWCFRTISVHCDIRVVPDFPEQTAPFFFSVGRFLFSGWEPLFLGILLIYPRQRRKTDLLQEECPRPWCHAPSADTLFPASMSWGHACQHVLSPFPFLLQADDHRDPGQIRMGCKAPSLTRQRKSHVMPVLLSNRFRFPCPFQKENGRCLNLHRWVSKGVSWNSVPLYSTRHKQKWHRQPELRLPLRCGVSAMPNPASGSLRQWSPSIPIPTIESRSDRFQSPLFHSARRYKRPFRVQLQPDSRKSGSLLFRRPCPGPGIFQMKTCQKIRHFPEQQGALMQKLRTSFVGGKCIHNVVPCLPGQTS